jgi:hypothetical protein
MATGGNAPDKLVKLKVERREETEEKTFEFALG